MISKKLINDKEDIVIQTIEGYVKSQNGRLKLLKESQVIVRSKLDDNKVGMIMGNGAGHEPDALGYVGENFMDANSIGGLFAAPGPHSMLEAIKAADTGAGVVVLISNCAGDILNSKLAIKMAKKEGIEVGKVLICGSNVTDIDTGDKKDRRGGGIIATKMICGYAGLNKSIKEIEDFADVVLDNIRSISIGIKPGTSPITGQTMYELEEDKICIGVGGHGESGVENIEMCTSEELADYTLDKILSDKPFVPGDELTFVVNGFGSTTLMEQFVFYNDVYSQLEKRGFKVHNPIVGSLSTIQESSGIDLSIGKIENDDMRKTWDLKTDAAYFPKQYL